MMRRFLGVSGILIVALGTFFAVYDMFPFFHEWNSANLPVCRAWSSIATEARKEAAAPLVSGVDDIPYAAYIRGSDRYNKIKAIIEMNVDPAIKDPSRIVIGHIVRTRMVALDARVSSAVYFVSTSDDRELVSTADMLARWIGEFRRNWFLKWGLILDGFGIMLTLLALGKKEKKDIPVSELRLIHS